MRLVYKTLHNTHIGVMGRLFFLFFLSCLMFIGTSRSALAAPLSQFSQCLEKHLASEANKKNIKRLRHVQELCRKQLSSQPNYIELPAEVINNLKIEAGFGWGIFSGSIYNANENITITKLIVSMTPVHAHHMHHTEIIREPRKYIIETNLFPLSKSALSIALNEQDAPIHKFDWHISKAFGYKISP